MAILISWLALLGLLYQAYLQRTHNEKSLKPLGQIDLRDRKDQIYVRVSNNGMGPLIIDRLVFTKDGKTYTAIEDCLELDRRSYSCIGVSESAQKVVLPNSHLVVFESKIEPHEEEGKTQQIREQLSLVNLQVEFRDIYDNKKTIERDFQWFSRHSPVTVEK